MAARKRAPEVHEARALFFRARRSHLAGDGAPRAAAAAASILGAQAQQDGPALFALSQRTRGRPTAAALRSALVDHRPPLLVRTWGQRDTLHLYDPADWPTVIAARAEWPQSGRRGGMPTADDVAAAREVFERAEGPLLRRDLFPFIRKSYVDELADHPGAGGQPIRLAATRLVWCLAMEGAICFAGKTGSEQAYDSRERRFPDLDWPAKPDPAAAAAALARRYLGVFGPATAADLAHFFGARVITARTWLERLGRELAEVGCGEREGLVALSRDLGALAEEPPRGDGWPVRLLPKWDTHLMTHKDKSWVTLDAAEAPRIWRKAADIRATVVARGRVVALWSHRATRKLVRVDVEPLSGWRAGYRRAVEREARAFAAHLELPAVEVEVG